MSEKIKESFAKLADYCERENYKGYDPFDGLNSKLFDIIPILKENKFFKIAWIQFFKRSPINFRSFAGINKEYNPKGLGLFLAGYCKLYRIDPISQNLEKIKVLIKEIIKYQTPGYSGSCWGYNFDWQAKAFFQPKNTPTVVATTFVANALLDAFEITQEEQLLITARSACNFIVKDLNRTYDEFGNFAFSYSPIDKIVVFNASLLGSRLLSRVYHFTHDNNLLEPARKSVKFCCNYQQDDGAWSYGTLDFHQWIDNFHTGFNLECIADYMKYTGDNSFEKHLNKGFDYYINSFFTREGLSKYYNNSVYPIDIHAPAQLILTLSKLGKFQEYRDLAEKVLLWTIGNMQSDEGYYYYQVNKYFSSKIPYIRWAQAWMFYALSEYLLQADNPKH